MTTNTLSTTTAAPMHRPRKPFPLGKIIAWVILVLTFIVILFPMWWVVRTSFSTKKEVIANPTSLLPVGFTTEAYQRVLGLVDTKTAVAQGGSGQKINFWLYLRNSLIVAGIVVVAQTFFSALGAYAFARLKFPFRDQLFYLYLAALMVPAIVTLIPNFVLIRQLHWEDSFLGIVAPTLLMSPFAVFFLRQFFLGINKELEEAARLDGAGTFTIFSRIILPISMPPVITLGILTFVATWNSYLWPFLVGKSEEVRVLTVALAVFRSQTPQGSPDWPGLMAGAVISMIPTLLVFIIVGRRVVNSIQFTGFK